MGENITVNQKVTGISGDIRELQLALEKLGYLDTEGYYGYYGEKTLRAVNKYKEDHNLDNKGVNYGKVGKSTLESIEKELENKQKKRLYHKGFQRITRSNKTISKQRGKYRASKI